MNEANDFYEDMRSRHQAVLTWRDGSVGDSAGNPTNSNGGDAASRSSVSVSGNGDAKDNSPSSLTTDGTPSPATREEDLTPNG